MQAVDEMGVQNFLESFIRKIAKDEVSKNLQSDVDQDLGKTWTLDEFRKKCCFGKDREWIKLFIFAQFKKEITIDKPGGWLKPSKGRGSAYGIYALEARKWMQTNRNRIDWDARLPDQEVMKIKLLVLIAVLIVVNGLCQLAKSKWR